MRKPQVGIGLHVNWFRKLVIAAAVAMMSLSTATANAQWWNPIGFVVHADTLYRVDGDGVRYALSTSWTGATSLAYGTWLHVIQSNRLWRASPNDGSYIELGTADWSGPSEMAWNTTTGKLYIVQAGHLHRMDDANNNGNYTILGGTIWNGTTSMASLGGSLYIVRNSSLYKVDPVTGSRVILGTAGIWGGPTRMAVQAWGGGVGGASVYIVQADKLHKVNPSTGAWTVLGGNDWWADTTSMFCNGSGTFTSYLNIFDNSRLYKVEATGNYYQRGGAIWAGPTVSAGANCAF